LKENNILCSILFIFPTTYFPQVEQLW